MPSENPWDPFWMERTGGPEGLWPRVSGPAYFRKSDNILNQSFISDRWPAHPEVPVEDQRGLTLPELDLQAQFQKARGLGPWAPMPPLDPVASQSAIAKDLGMNDIEAAEKALALRRAGEILSMHAPDTGPRPNTGRPDLPTRKVVKKKEVK